MKGLLVPLNSSQVVIFTAGKLYPSSSATYDQRVYYSYVDGQVINIASNGSVSFGSVVRVTEGRNSLGMGPYMAAKVDNNRIVFGGLNSTWGSRTSQYEHPGAMMIQVSGNNMWTELN